MNDGFAGRPVPGDGTVRHALFLAILLIASAPRRRATCESGIYAALDASRFLRHGRG